MPTIELEKKSHFEVHLYTIFEEQHSESRIGVMACTLVCNVYNLLYLVIAHLSSLQSGIKKCHPILHGIHMVFDATFPACLWLCLVCPDVIRLKARVESSL